MHNPVQVQTAKCITIVGLDERVGLGVGERVCEGFSDGCDWIVTRSCVCHHREMREMCMTTLVFNEYVWIQRQCIFDITHLRARYSRDTWALRWLWCWPIWLWRFLRRLTTGLWTYRWRLRRDGRWLTRYTRILRRLGRGPIGYWRILRWLRLLNGDEKFCVSS